MIFLNKNVYYFNSYVEVFFISSFIHIYFYTDNFFFFFFFGAAKAVNVCQSLI